MCVCFLIFFFSVLEEECVPKSQPHRNTMPFSVSFVLDPVRISSREMRSRRVLQSFAIRMFCVATTQTVRTGVKLHRSIFHILLRSSIGILQAAFAALSFTKSRETFFRKRIAVSVVICAEVVVLDWRCVEWERCARSKGSWQLNDNLILMLKVSLALENATS